MPLAEVDPHPLPEAAAGAAWLELRPGIAIRAAAATPAARRVLPDDALDLVARLHRELEPDRRRLLAERAERQRRWDAGEAPGYLDGPEAAAARGGWRVAEVPPDLRRRRVEITGPVNNAKMVINMLSRTADGHRADAAMLDFEDSMKPAWANVVDGVENVRDAARGALTFTQEDPAGGAPKVYRLDPEDMPILMVRCRGLHLDEANLAVDGEPVAAGLLDLALSAYHSAAALVERRRTPKYYVPKCEHYLEARWWNRLLIGIQRGLGLAPGTFRATFLIETLPAAFQMEEILHEIREHAAGLNVGRWDKIFSDIKVLKEHPHRVLADRATISLNRPWMRDYATRLIRVCHGRGAYAIGGMAAFTPGASPERRAEQTAKVVADKRLEAELGHDGCWVSHPYFIGPAMSAFEREHQLDTMPGQPERPDLLPAGGGPRTLAGLRTNVRVGIAYLHGWRQDVGCIAWDDLMEDLATLEISRAQTWQWLRHGVALDDGGRALPATRELVSRIFDEELERILAEARAAPGGGASAEELAAWRGSADAAREIFTESTFRPFLAGSSEPAGGGEAINRAAARKTDEPKEELEA